MKLTRGDVVLVDFPQGRGMPTKRRPAVVVQSDHNNSRLTTGIFVGFSSNLKLRGIEATQVYVDTTTPDGRSAGIARSSVIKCENIQTFDYSMVIRVLGKLSPELMTKVDAALKISLGLQ
jgi:mRNA interferase MazF